MDVDLHLEDASATALILPFLLMHSVVLVVVALLAIYQVGRRLSGGETGSIHLEMQDVGTRVMAGRIKVLALASNLA